MKQKHKTDALLLETLSHKQKRRNLSKRENDFVPERKTFGVAT